jgi:hypothetical protein
MTNVLAPKRQIRMYQNGHYLYTLSIEAGVTDQEVAAKAKAAMRLGDHWVARHHLGTINFVVPG